jgi:hypothetical protein
LNSGCIPAIRTDRQQLLSSSAGQAEPLHRPVRLPSFVGDDCDDAVTVDGCEQGVTDGGRRRVEADERATLGLSAELAHQHLMALGRDDDVVAGAA